jgi:hypothetical protein
MGLSTKLDQGFKGVMRDFRKFLAKLFKKSRYSKQHTRWYNFKRPYDQKNNDDIWFDQVRNFLDIRFANDYDVAVAILLIYPAFGPSTGRKGEIKKPLDKSTRVYRELKDHGMKIYKTSITRNNNEDLRDAFFNTPIV